MRKTPTALFAALLGLSFALAGSLVPSEANALVFCAKTKKPSKIKVRGDACKANETEVVVPAVPEAQSQLDALDGEVAELTSSVASLASQNHIYVVSRTQGPGEMWSEIPCNDGDVATGGGAISSIQGCYGPFVTFLGPLVDEFSKPIGWSIGMSDVANDIELYVVCAQVSEL